MWLWGYNIAITSYTACLRIAALFHRKARLWVEGRSTLFERLETFTFEKTLWFHCASVGEFEQGLPLIRLLQQDYPESTLLLTFFSPSGYSYALEHYPEFQISYLPTDTPAHAKRFLQQVRPQAAFFIKYEFWFHHLLALHEAGIPTFLISGIFRKEQWLFKPYGAWFRSRLKLFTRLFLQNESSKQLLFQFGITQTNVCGDTRIDRVRQISLQPWEDALINDFCGKGRVFVAGSIWEQDLPAIRTILQVLPPDWRIILVPHEPEEFPEAAVHEPCMYYSDGQLPVTPPRVMIVDTMGLLSRLYRKASMAYIGGGYGRGIHNLLEAVVYEIPVFMGPNHTRFQEANDLLHAGVAFNMETPRAKVALQEIVTDTAARVMMKEQAANYMQTHTNVSERIRVLLKNDLPDPAR